MKKSNNGTLSKEQVTELVYQALETEMGGVEIYRMALKCAVNDDLREEWEEYLGQTEVHVEKLQGVCSAMGLDPSRDTPGRQVVRHIGKSLVKAMALSLGSGPPRAAELVAAECVTLAETKDHMNWELLGMVAKKLTGDGKQELTEAYDSIEEEEDEHLYHTAGWGRELWIQSLGLPAVIPPPEEKKKVKTAIGAARARQARSK